MRSGHKGRDEDQFKMKRSDLNVVDERNKEESVCENLLVGMEDKPQTCDLVEILNSSNEKELIKSESLNFFKQLTDNNFLDETMIDNICLRLESNNYNKHFLYIPVVEC